MTHQKSALWALDAFAEKTVQTKNLDVMFNLCEALKLQIDPVYILSSGQLQIQNEFYPNWALDYKKAAGTLMEGIIKDSNYLNIKSPTVLTSSTDNLRGAVDALLKFAKQNQSKAIFVNSHANEGLTRFFLGSFVETLLLQSKIPVVVTNPSTEKRSKIKKIMLPTSFFSDTKQGLEDAVLLANRLHAELHIYHKEIVPTYLAFPEAPFYTIYIDDIAKKLKKNEHDWMEWAKKQGVNAKVIIDKSQEAGVIGKHIIKYAEKNHIDLICLMSQSSQIEAAILGSTARYVVRHAHCPVWVHHT